MKFGTDGVRGRAFDEVTEQLAFDLGRAAAEALPGPVVVGRDTRESGPAIAAALAAGAVFGGASVIDIGVAPTPAVAHVAATRGSGAMISASHNPWHDNGIKLFSRGGNKLSDAEQQKIERLVAGYDHAYVAEPDIVVDYQPLLVGEWVQSVVASVDGDLNGLKVVVDGANGAAAHVAASTLIDLGAEVSAIAIEPDGRNINEACGSTHPQLLQQLVADSQADIGIAFDGDADRLVCVDEQGRVVDGDQIMAIIATDLAERSKLTDNTVVVTVMSNLGFHRP